MGLLMFYKIVETDNFGGDYPDEKFVTLPLLSQSDACTIAGSINACLCDTDDAPRYWKVVENGYVLQPGFEP